MSSQTSKQPEQLPCGGQNAVHPPGAAYWMMAGAPEKDIQNSGGKYTYPAMQRGQPQKIPDPTLAWKALAGSADALQRFREGMLHSRVCFAAGAPPWVNLGASPAWLLQPGPPAWSPGKL